MPHARTWFRSALTLLVGILMLVPQGAAFAAGPAPTPGESMLVSATATGDVLLGEPTKIVLTARNTGVVEEFNLSFRYVLPTGVTYVPGSSVPAGAEPQQVTAPGGERVLIWRNVSDLPIDGEQTLGFSVAADINDLPVGSTFQHEASAYASSDERTVPSFNANGVYSSGATVHGDATHVDTRVSAIKVEKSEPSPEHELVRGVHAHPTTYTLTVTNNGHRNDDNVVLVDHLPAQLEFLGCGDVDNTSGNDVEYAGAPRLDAIPDVSADCPVPASVTTVQDPTGLPAGIYTRVRWNLGTLTPGQVVQVRYAAGIPQRANTLDFDGPTPNGASLEQAANLDNNTGPSTRETTTEQSLTNHVEVTADYTGQVAGGGSKQVSHTDQLTVTSEDVAIQKSVTPGAFVHGGTATYTLTLQTGEYAEADDIVITDKLPDGLCPLGAGLPLCPAGPAPSLPYDSVTENADGTHTMVFDAIAMDASDQVTITYQARMLSNYRTAGSPTVAGDGFVNTVGLVAQTTTLPGVNAPDPGTRTVNDDSSARIDGQAVTLDKRILPNTGATPHQCAPNANAYLNRVQGDDDADFTFNEGSRVCFLLEVTFPSGVDTKNPVVTDFLPAGLAFESGAALASNDVDFAVTGGGTKFLLGRVIGGDRFAAPGEVFRYVVSAIVRAPAGSNKPDVTGNLLKLRWTNTEGQVSFLRDRVDFLVPPAPPVTVVKTASQGVVRAGDVVDYTVDIKNTGKAADGNARPVLGPDVWDRLPAGITCSDVVAGSISDSGSCTDPGAGTHPTFNGNDVRSAIRWNLPDSRRIAPGDTFRVTYQVRYPATVAAGSTYRNDVDVASYGTETNLETVVQHFPGNNVDNTVDPDNVDAPRAHDDVTVRIPDTAISKSNTTQVDDATQGTGASHFVAIGESVTYQVTGTLPADTTVYSGVLSDTPPSRIRFDSVTYEFSADNGTTWSALPAGWTGSPTAASVTLPTTYQVDASADLVRMTISATTVANGPTSPSHGQSLVNTAHLTSTDQFGTNPNDLTAPSTVVAVHPNPAPRKSANNTTPGATDTVTYTVTARNVNPANAAQVRPVLFETTLVDCVPAGLVVDPASLAVTTGTATIEPSGSNGCAAGSTTILWEAGDLAWRAAADLPGNPWPVLTYDVDVDRAAGGGAAYTNVVTQAGTSMDGTNPDERTYSNTANQTVTVPGAGLTKTVTPLRAPVGDVVTYSVKGQVPARVNLYDATIVDQLPIGIAASSVSLDSVTWSYSDGAPGSPSGLPSATALTPAGNAHGWFLGDIAADPRPREVTVVYTAVVGAGEASNTAGTARINSADLAWNSTDRITGSDLPTTSTTFAVETPPDTATVIVQEPRLSVAKTVNQANPKPGESFTYTVTVTNATGANVSTAHGIDLVDDIPSGVRVTPGTISNGGVLSGTGGNGGNGSITWTSLPSLAPGASVQLSYQARLVSPAPTTAQTNTVDITRYTSLPAVDGSGRTYDGPEDTAVVTPALPELEIVKSLLDSAPAYRGTPVRWQLKVTNTGDATAHDVDVVDLLPPDWAYDADSARIAFAGGPAAAREPAIAGRELSWTNLGDLAVNQTIVVVFTATPGASAAVGSGVVHLNEASTTGKDVDGGSVVTTNDDDEPTRIDAADVRIVKGAQGTPVAGRPFSWTLDVSNIGPDQAVGPITVTDTLPLGVTGVSAVGSGWNISIVPGTGGTASTVTATRNGTVTAGATLPPITVTATIPASTAPGTDLVNTGRVTSKTFDPNQPNNEHPVTSQVTTISDFGIEKSLGGTLVPGDTATYTIAATNHGPSQARGPITVVDTLPAGLTYDSHTGTGWKLTRDGQELTFLWEGATPVALGALPAITVTVQVASSLTTAVTNTVKVNEPTDPTSGPEEDDTDTVTSPAEPSADLELAKVHVGDFRAGEQGTYRFSVVNHGPSDAAGPVRILDTLPTSLDYVSVNSTDGWACSATGQVLTCELAAGLSVQKGSTTLDVTVDIDEALVGDVTNTAVVSSPTRDPHSPNNEDSDGTGIDVVVDLAIDKRLVTAPVIAGEQATYELTVTNNGPATSPGPITVADTLPAGLTLVSVTGAGWSCAPANGVPTCERAASLGSGVSAPVITVVAQVASDVGTADLVNIASVDGPAIDPNRTNNTDREPTRVTEAAEIVVDKTTTGPNPVRAGERATFEIEVRNTGSSDARNVVADDLLPAGMTLSSISGAGWTCTDGTCARDRIAAGTSAPVITVVALVASGTPEGTNLVNRVEVSTVTPGDTPAGNRDDADVDVVAEADLALVKTHVGTAVAGTTTSYELQVTNNGPSDAVGPLTVTDLLPAGMTFMSAAAPWACTTGSGNQRAGQVDCVLADGLVAGAKAPVLEMQVQLAASLSTGPLTNTAEVDSPTTDPVPTNDKDDEVVVVERIADVSVTKSHTGPVRIGDELRFTLQVRNEGPSQARDVTVTDALPKGLELVSAQGSGWQCDTTQGQVSCVLDGPLAPQADANPITVVTRVRPAAYPQVVNTVKVATSSPDPKPENDQDDDLVRVPAQVDLAIEKKLVGELVVGESADYRLVVTNKGPTTAPGPITVTDLLPAGLTYQGSAGEGWTCTAQGQSVTCVLAGDLGVDQSSTLTLEVAVAASAYPQVVNTASVSSGSEDPNPKNDVDKVTSPVRPTVDLDITKTVKSQQGRRVTYLLTVTNQGPSATVEPIVVRDKLPASLELVQATGPGWACTPGAPGAVCTHAEPLGAGDSLELQVITRITGEPKGKIVNIATVSGGGDETGDTDRAKIDAPSDGGNTGEKPGTKQGEGGGEETGGGLPSTGGPAWWLGLLGLGMAITGVLTLRRFRTQA